MLLIHELYRETLGTSHDTGKGIPIKKIFVKNGRFEIDKTPIDTYGEIKTPNNMKNYLQRNFGMPLDTIDGINLPNKLVAPNSPKPYIVIPGMINIMEKNGVKHGQIRLGYKGKKDGKPSSYATLTMPDNTVDIHSVDVYYNIDKTNYTVDGAPLYNKYISNNILSAENTLGGNIFESISRAFFEYLSSKDISLPVGKINFGLYVLPDNKKISYTQPVQKNNDGVSDGVFIDAFGNKCTGYPDRPSKGVFWFTYDDPAFVINCKSGRDFYKDIGIGKDTLDKIIHPETKKIEIAGFDWYFMNIEKPKMIFGAKKMGIYHQIHSNYHHMKKMAAREPHIMKVFCVKRANSKVEILVNENLSMPRLDVIFGKHDFEDIPHTALESLIIKKGKVTIFTHYIHGIKSILNQTGFDHDLLVKTYTKSIRDNMKNWLEKSSQEPTKFFEKTEFCRKVLKRRRPEKYMEQAEAQFAKEVGMMARTYIEFRKENGFKNNSYMTILQKNTYTVSTLQDVIKSIGRSLHLLKIDENDYDKILMDLTKIAPSEVDTDSKKDLSYYFYLGYFRGSDRK